MTDHTEWLGKIVELTETASHYYPVAIAGWRGVVTDTKLDEESFVRIYLEWDADHWLYTPGQPDGWTYPGHFIVVGEVEKTEVPSKGEEPPELQEVNPPDADADEKREYLNLLFEYAVAEARGADAFALVWIGREEVSPGVVVNIPSRVASAIDSNTRDLLEVQVMEAAQEVFARAMQERIDKSNDV